MKTSHSSPSGQNHHSTAPTTAANPAVATAVFMLSSLPPVPPADPPTVPTPDPVVDQWAAKINDAVGEGIAWLIVTGTQLIEAKAALEHGQWMAMFESHRVGFSLRTAEMFMRATKLGPLSDAQTFANLPPRLSTLDALAGGSPEVIKLGIQTGAIHPEMTAKQAREFVRSQNGSPPTAKPATSFDPDKRWNRVQLAVKKEATKWPDDARCQLADLLEVLAKDIRASLPAAHQQP